MPWKECSVRRTTRSDARIDRPAPLSALGTCRGAVIREMTTMKVAGPLYYSGSTVVAAIDTLALMLTGQRDYFALKPHGVGGSNAR
jgi:cupin 2 domain-containing protein